MTLSFILIKFGIGPATILAFIKNLNTAIAAVGLDVENLVLKRVLHPILDFLQRPNMNASEPEPHPGFIRPHFKNFDGGNNSLVVSTQGIDEVSMIEFHR